MATRKTVDKIQIKRGSGTILSDTQKDTVLAEGEPFYHKNTGRVCIGNGTNKISDLPYLQANESDGIALGINGTIASNHGVAIGNNSSAVGGISIGANVVSTANNLAIGENIGANPSDKGIYIGFDSGPCSNAVSSSSIVIGVNSTAVASYSASGANHVISIGTNTVAHGSNSISLGRGANAVRSGSISIGTTAVAEGFQSISIGNGANTNGDSSVSIGDSASCLGANGTAIGANSVSAEGGVAIGANASQTSASICIGENSSSVRTNCISIGNRAKVTNISGDPNENALAIGTGAEAMSGSSIAIGRTCVAGGNGSSQTGDACIAIGEDSEASGDNGISIGTDSHSTAPRSIAFGTCSVASSVGSISIGSYSHAGGYAVDIGGSAKFVGDNYSTRDITGEESVSILGFSGGDFGVSIGEGSSAGKLGVSIGYNAKTIIPYGDNISRVAIGKEAVASNDNDARIQFFDHSTGGFENHAFIGSSAILLSGSSDRRLKQNIESANTEMCLSDVCSIPLYKYEYKPFVKETEDKHLVGWMADDVEKVFKHAVFEGDRTFTECDDDGNDIIDPETGEPKQFTIEKVKSINMQRVGLPTLWGAVQELNKLMTATQERVTELETSVKTLKKENTLLKKKLKELDTSTKEEPSIEE